MDEDARIARILARVADAGPLVLGPGHDCAAVDVGGAVAVLTSDVLVDGVHFRLAEDGARAAARKALLVNLSDLAAAGARPVAFEVGVVLPRDADPDLLDALAEGFGETARRWGCPLAGGDTNVADGPLVLAVTAVGRPGAGGLVTRAGARPGDHLSVTGPLGGSLAGRHLDFPPRLAEGEALARLGVARAMMDLSDGLGRDLPRLCRASNVGAVVDAERVPVHADAEGEDALDRALDDGEDFELLVAHAPLDDRTREALAAEGVVLIRIGEVVSAEEGVTLRRDGGREPLAGRGWDHFEAPWTVEVADPAAMRALGAALGRAARSHVLEGAVVVGLRGDLGAGKTVLAQGAAAGFGVPPDAEVVSPTFTIARSYPTEDAQGRTLHHVDAYRLDGPEALEHAGFEDMCGKGALTCVEWSGRVAEGLPSDRLEVAIVLLPAPAPPPGSAPVAARRVTVRARGPRARAVLDDWRRAERSGA